MANSVTSQMGAGTASPIGAAAGPGLDFDALENLESRLLIAIFMGNLQHLFEKGIPPYGLLLVAKCKTPACDLHDFVVIEKGIGKFDVLQLIFEKYFCPHCKKELSEVHDIWFSDCKYAIEGKQIEPVRKIVKYSGNANTDGGIGFLQSRKKTIVRWLTLEVTTEMKPWKVSQYGLNLFGRCSNKICDTQGEKVCVPIQGNGPHYTSKLNPKCSICNFPLSEIDRIWLRNCEYTIQFKNVKGEMEDSDIVVTQLPGDPFPSKMSICDFRQDLIITLTQLKPD